MVARCTMMLIWGWEGEAPRPTMTSQNERQRDQKASAWTLSKHHTHYLQSKTNGGGVTPNHSTCASQSEAEPANQEAEVVGNSRVQAGVNQQLEPTDNEAKKRAAGWDLLHKVFCFTGQVPEELGGKERKKRVLPQTLSKSRGHN